MILIAALAYLPYTVSSQPLATGKGKFLGSSVKSVRSDFTKYWNQVTADDAGKWGSVEGTQDAYTWTPLDNIYNFAITNGFPYKHHNLVWGNQQPSWITSLDSASQRAQVEEWIRLVGERYPKTTFVDVVNEPLNGPAAYRNALGGNGTTGWDWVITVFQWARKHLPGAKLHINEYNVLQSNTVTDRYIALIDTLKARGLIDGLGIQGHYFEFKSSAGSSPSYSYPVSTLKSNLDRLATRGLPIYITEFDINEIDDGIQLQNYQIYFPLFWDHPSVKGITLWGYAENSIWKPYAFLIDYRNAPRPALQWLKGYVAGPAIPAIISPTGASAVPRNPKLIWRSSSSASSYRVRVSDDSTLATALVDATVSDTVLQLSPLRPNTTHYWQVNATNTYGTSDYSLTRSFVTNSTVVGVEESGHIPEEFALHQNYPNPFSAGGGSAFGGNPTTSISFHLPTDLTKGQSGLAGLSQLSSVKLIVYDALGREVATLVDGEKPAGSHTVVWNAKNVPSGVYIYRIVAGDHVDSKKMLLMK
ncbi:MAG: endo-1,4-beta-xylanase [Ignavibacteriales bacterium]|nr:endo-1,4-beta-xylanase [Ignavibacteriales bacterium]